MEEEWKPDFGKLQNYKIVESKFENPNFKDFTNCVFPANIEKNIEENIDRCRFHLPFKYKVESGGDMRCSGKSEILYLMFPFLRHSIEFGTEEEGRGYPIESKIKSFTEPDFNKLVIYVKRNPDERLKCLLRYRSAYREDIEREPDYYDSLPNELKDESQKDMEDNRKMLLPSTYQHKNYIILENQNKEKEPLITKDKICKISKKQLEKLKEEVKGNLRSDKMFVDKGLKDIILTRGKEFYESSTKYAQEKLGYIKEYEKMCHISNEIKRIENIMEERNKLRFG